MPSRFLERRLFGRELEPPERQLLLRFIAMLVPMLVLGLVLPIGAALLLVDRESQARFAQIQRERAEITHEACMGQNDRHDATIKTLDTLIDQIVQNTAPAEREARRIELAGSRGFTVLLIDALAPEQDCDAIVRARFGLLPGPE